MSLCPEHLDPFNFLIMSSGISNGNTVLNVLPEYHKMKNKVERHENASVEMAVKLR